MSSVSSVNASESNLYLQYLLQEAGRSGGTSTNSTESALTTLASSSEPSGSTSTDSLESQLQGAITSAIQNVEDSGGSSSNLETAVKAAVDKTLTANGIDPDKFQQDAAAGPSGTGNSSGTQLSASLRDLLANVLGQQSGNSSLVGLLVNTQG
jgi:hypothetical protein